MDARDSRASEEVRVGSADSSGAEKTEESSGWIDYIYNNTSQWASKLQWGESAAPYSLSADLKRVTMMQNIIQDTVDKRRKSHCVDMNAYIRGYRPSPASSSPKCSFSAEASSPWSFGSSAANNEASSPKPAKVVETLLYDRLNVSPNAKKNEIKQSYYKLALEYHPDKNPNDASAKRKFQEISEAYQVLSDDAMRAKYDMHGSQAMRDMPMIDPCLFFMLLFDCDDLEDYIGTLKIASFFRFASQSTSSRAINLTSKMDLEQDLREVTLAVKLRHRLDAILEHGKIPEDLKQELVEFCSSAFGDTLVESIGWVYENTSDVHVGEATTFWGLGATLPNIQAAGRSINNTWSMAKSVVNVALVVKDLSRAAANAGESEDDANAKANANAAAATLSSAETMDKLKDIITNTLSLVLYDVEATVKIAATKVCKDEDVSPRRRMARANVLKKLGILMQRTAQECRKRKEKEPMDVSQQMYNAFIKASQREEQT